MTSLFASKKGIARSILAAVIALFVFGFITIFGYYLFTEFTDAMDDAGQYTGDVQRVGEIFKSRMRWFDNVGVLLLAAFVIGIGATSYRVASSPVFFIISLLLGLFYGFISYFFNFMFQELVSVSVLNSATAAFPKLVLICTNLHWLALAMLVVGTITLYGKQEKGQFLS